MDVKEFIKLLGADPKRSKKVSGIGEALELWRKGNRPEKSTDADKDLARIDIEFTEEFQNLRAEVLETMSNESAFGVNASQLLHQLQTQCPHNYIVAFDLSDGKNGENRLCLACFLIEEDQLKMFPQVLTNKPYVRFPSAVEKEPFFAKGLYFNVSLKKAIEYTNRLRELFTI